MARSDLTLRLVTAYVSVDYVHGEQAPRKVAHYVPVGQPSVGVHAVCGKWITSPVGVVQGMAEMCVHCARLERVRTST